MSAKKSRPAGVQSGQPAAELAGGSAEQPTDIPAKGWLQVAKRAWAEAKDDQVPLLSAGVEFFGFLSLFPALIAAILTYGLFADPAQVRDHIAQLSGTLPSAARSLLEQQRPPLWPPRGRARSASVWPSRWQRRCGAPAAGSGT